MSLKTVLWSSCPYAIAAGYNRTDGGPKKKRLSTNVSSPNIHIPSLNVVEEKLFSLPTADCQLLAAKLGFSYAVNQREGSIMFVLVNHFCDSVVKKITIRPSGDFDIIVLGKSLGSSVMTEGYGFPTPQNPQHQY